MKTKYRVNFIVPKSISPWDVMIPGTFINAFYHIPNCTKEE